MAANSDLLQQLADIYEPELATSWQLAPGHWLIILAVVGVLAAISYYCYRRWQFNAAKRLALAELASIDWQAPNAAPTLNLLFKRLFKHYFPQHPLLSSNTQIWQTYWQTLLPATQPLPDLQQLLYHTPSVNHQALCQQLWQATEYAIKHFNPKKPVVMPVATGVSHV